MIYFDIGNCFVKIFLIIIYFAGSELEQADLKKAYTNGKGDMDHILETVPFSEEERVREVVLGMISRQEVPEFETFVNEPPENKIRRKRKVWLKIFL